MHSSFRLAAALLSLGLSATVFDVCAHSLMVEAPGYQPEFQFEYQALPQTAGTPAMAAADAHGVWYLQTLRDDDILLPPRRTGGAHGAAVAPTPVPESSQYRLLLVGVALLLLCGGWRQAAPETPWAAIKVD